MDDLLNTLKLAKRFVDDRPYLQGSPDSEFGRLSEMLGSEISEINERKKASAAGEF